MNNVVLFGTGELADVVRFYLEHDSPHRVSAFTADREYIREATVSGLPVIAFDEVEKSFPTQSYGMFIANGILFNHESERRGENFITRKITLGIREIVEGKRHILKVGNLDAKRDWGHAQDYVQAMYLMLQRKTPRDYVIGTGVQHSVREFCERAFREAGFELIWKGKGRHEKGIDKKTGRTLVAVDSKFFRPNEVWSLCSNPAKARRELGCKPEINFATLVKRMVRNDLAGVTKK